MVDWIKMKTVFKVGHEVYDSIFFGNLKGVVEEVINNPFNVILKVKFGDKEFRYFGDGVFIGDKFDNRILTHVRTLSFRQYGLKDFTQGVVSDYSSFIGNYGKFWNNGFEELVVVNKLNVVNVNTYGDLVFSTFNSETFDNFEPLTKEQLECLNLKN